MRILRHFLDFLFPKKATVLQLEKMSYIELMEKVKRSPKPPPHIYSIFAYKDPLIRELLWDIKYRANHHLAKIIAPIIIEECIMQLADEVYFNEEDKPIITFIPATKNRKKVRGFDQGEIILNAIEKEDKDNRFEYKRDILRFARNVIQQSITKNRAHRFSNMDDAFKCNNRELVKGKTIIILDDVCTTGATLLDARRALLDSGANKVYCLTITH